ncbi:MAG: putative zinc-binding metallopeptidase [Phycisphaerae bacterium]
MATGTRVVGGQGITGLTRSRRSPGAQDATGQETTDQETIGQSVQARYGQLAGRGDGSVVIPRTDQGRRSAMPLPARRRVGRVASETPLDGSLHWESYSDDELLGVRLCDLGLRIEGTQLESCLARSVKELKERGLRLRPHFWLSTEWFTPDGVPGVALPFYLAHPRLKRMERRQMLEVEGGTSRTCMRLLRHEFGHAIDNAFRLSRRRKYREIFGSAATPYPDHYHPKPFSRRFVLHLDYWYAQSHPSEDFAETFAVWLTPGSNWKKVYRGWPAMQKLLYVDELMKEIADTPPPVRTRERTEALSQVKMTLGEYYEQKRERYGALYPEFYDRDLLKLFSADGPGEPASRFLTRIRSDIRKLVADGTGEYHYTIDLVLREMIERSRQLKLRLDKPAELARDEAIVLVTVQTMNFLHSGFHRIAV